MVRELNPQLRFDSEDEGDSLPDLPPIVPGTSGNAKSRASSSKSKRKVVQRL